MCPGRYSFVLLVEIAANDRTHDRTSSNEPPTGHQAFDNDGNDPCDGPAPCTARTGPQGNEHRGEKCRHDEIESVFRRVSNEAADEITGARADEPGGPNCAGCPEIHGNIAAALGAIAHGNQPGRICEKKQRRVGLPGWPLPEPWAHGDTHQEKARPDHGREHSDCENRAPCHDGRPDFQRDKLGDTGADQKIHGEALHDVRPCRAAPAPTTTPNAMMPGATGSPRRIPRTKPDQRDLSGGVSFGAIEESAWVGELGSHGFPHESRWPGQCPAMTTANGEFTLAAEERSHPTAAPAADVACRRAVLRTSVAWSGRWPIHGPGVCPQGDP